MTGKDILNNTGFSTDKLPGILRKALPFIIITAAVIFAIVVMGLVSGKHFSKLRSKNEKMHVREEVFDRFDKALEAVVQKRISAEHQGAARGINVASKSAFLGIGGKSKLLLNGIVQTTGKLVAFLNDRILRVGDEINGYKVTSIKDDSVTVVDKKGNRDIVQLRKKD